MDMENVSLMGFVNAIKGTLVLTAPLVKEYPFVSSSFHMFSVLVTDILFNYGEITWNILSKKTKTTWNLLFFLVAFMFLMIGITFSWTFMFYLQRKYWGGDVHTYWWVVQNKNLFHCYHHFCLQCRWKSTTHWFLIMLFPHWSVCKKHISFGIMDLIWRLISLNQWWLLFQSL